MEDEDLLEFDDRNESDKSNDEFVEESNHNSDSEESDEECVENLNAWLLGPQYASKDKKSYSNMHSPSKNIRTRSHNIVRLLPGVKKNAQSAKTIEDAWRLFFPDTMLEKIVEYTYKRLDLTTPERDVLPTNLIEIKSVIGPLYLAGVMKFAHINLDEFWFADDTGMELF